MDQQLKKVFLCTWNRANNEVTCSNCWHHCDGWQFLYFHSKLCSLKAEEEKKLVGEPKAVAEREMSATFRVPVEVETIFTVDMALSLNQIG